MKKLCSFLLLSLTVLWPALAPALADPAIGELEQRLVTGPSHAQLVEYAAHRNPSILAARQSWNAIIAQSRLDTALNDPELEGSYAVDANDTANPMDWEIGLSQTFPFPGTLARKGEVATLNSRLAQLEFARITRDVLVQVRQSAAELGYIREARRIVTRNQELLDLLVKASVSASAKDRATLLDVTKAQSQAAQLQYDALLMAELETTEIARLNAALARPTAAPIGPLAVLPLRPMPYDLPALQQLAREALEELRLADVEIEKAQAEIRLARFETYPEIKLGAFVSGSREENSMTPGDYTDKNSVGVKAGISLPFWVDKNQGRLARAQAEAARARAARDAKSNEINAELAAAFFRLKNALRLVMLYEQELLPQATKAMTTAETWFKAGQGSFSDLVETETVYYNFELALARAKADYEKYLARLSQLCGKDLTADTSSTRDTVAETKKPQPRAAEDQAANRKAQAPFFTPDPERLKQLQPAADDDTAAIQTLADGFTLDDLLILTQLRSPALREAEASYRAMFSRYEQADALADLLDRYAAFTQGLEPGIGPMTGRTPLTMQYPFPGVTTLRGAIAHQDVQAALERLEATRRSIITAARQAFFELLYSHKAHALAQQSSVMLASLKDSLAARYEVGQADIPLLVRINQDYSRVAEQVAIQLAMQQARMEPIRALLALPAAAAIGRPAETSPDTRIPALDALLLLSLESRQELRELQSGIRRAELLIELAETAIYPGFSLNLSLPERNEVLAISSPAERPEAFGVTTKAANGAGRPLSQTYGIESAYLREARQNLIALREQLRAAEADTRRTVYEAWFVFDKAKREEAVSREKIVPLAQTDLDTISAGYAAGSLSFADLVEAATRWFDAKLAWERLRADLGMNRAALEEAIGSPLPKP